MQLYDLQPPYNLGPLNAIQAPRLLDRTMAAIERDPVASRHMRMGDAGYAIDKVVEEANEVRDAYHSRRGLHPHDTTKALEEAGDLAMSLQMAVRDMGYGRWTLSGAMLDSVKRMAWRWPKAKALYQQVKDWPQSWRDVKQGVDGGQGGA